MCVVMDIIFFRGIKQLRDTFLGIKGNFTGLQQFLFAVILLIHLTILEVMV